MRYVTLVALAVCFYSDVSKASIEGVASPLNLDSLGDVYRFSIFRSGNKVKYGECDTLESFCSPASELLTLKREMPYEEYVRQLAERFGVNAKYLLHHERALESTWAYLKTLDAICEDEDSLPEERRQAEAKRDAILDAGGVLDRFLQALQIKLALNEEPSNTFEEQHRLLQAALSRVRPRHRRHEDDREEGSPFAELDPIRVDKKGNVTYEQSVKQFEQAFWPVNFATSLEPENEPKNERFEPSTLKTWFLGHASTKRNGAEQFCQDHKGDFKMTDFSALKYAAPWILASSLGTSLGYTQGGSLPVWLPGVEGVRGRKLRTVRKQVEIYRNHFADRDVDEYELEVQFSYMMIGGPACEIRTAKIGTGLVHEDKYYDQAYLMRWADKAGEAAVLCVADKF